VLLIVIYTGFCSYECLKKYVIIVFFEKKWFSNNFTSLRGLKNCSSLLLYDDTVHESRHACMGSKLQTVKVAKQNIK